MPKLTEREREGFEKILEADLNAINKKFISQIKDFWGIARTKVNTTRGWDKLIVERENLETEKRLILQRIHEIEHLMTNEPLRIEQAVESVPPYFTYILSPLKRIYLSTI